MNRVLLLICLALAGLCAAPALAAGSVTVGLSDSAYQNIGANNPNFAGLGVNDVRAVVPYDVATDNAGSRQTAFVDWLNAITSWNASAPAAAQLTPLVTLEVSADPAKADPATGYPQAPTLAQYTAQVQAFVSAYGPGTRYDVTELSAWNEPDLNEVTNPLRGNPTLAAQYWVAASQACPGCTVLAGELAAGTPGDTWIDQYQTALQSAAQAADIALPTVWSWHPYVDVNDDQAGVRSDAPVTRWLLHQLTGVWANAQVWLDEVGAYDRDTTGKVWGDTSQQQTAEFLLGLQALSPRITRIYYYDLANICSTAAKCAVQDRGLVAPSPQDGSALGYDTAGRVRAAWSVVADKGPLIAPSAPLLPGVTVNAPGRPPAALTALSDAAGNNTGDASTVVVQLYAGSAAVGTPLQTLSAQRDASAWSAPLSASVPDGTYTAQAEQEGGTGDTATSAPVTFTLDTTPPAVTLQGVPAALTTARSASVSFTASKPNVSFTCADDGGAFVACHSPWTLTHLGLGVHRFQVSATDANGLATAAPAAAEWTVVSPAPVEFVASRGRLALATVLARGLRLTGTCTQGCRGELRGYITRAAAVALRVRDGRSVSARVLGLRRSTRYLAVARVYVQRSRAGRVSVVVVIDRAARRALARSRRSLGLRFAGTLAQADGSSARLTGTATLSPAGSRRSR